MAKGSIFHICVSIGSEFSKDLHLNVFASSVKILSVQLGGG